MAVGISTTKTAGRLIWSLERGEEKTTRSIEVPFAKVNTTDQEAMASLQTAVNDINSSFSETAWNLFMQPANWRDTNTSEEQWATTNISYEIVTTTVTPIEPDNNQSNG